MLYDILIDEGIIKYEDRSKDLKEKNQRLEKYLDKLERVQDKFIDNDRYLNMIKKLYYDRYIIKESDIPDNYLRSLEQQYLDQGHGHINLVSPQTEKDKNLRREHIQTIIREQRDSLDNWLNYFLSSDSSYLDMWAKVWAFQGMLHIGNINKNKDGYDRRSKTTVNPFVSFDSEILGKCVELVKESFNKKELTDEEIKKLVSSGSFSKLYGKLLANKKQIKAETIEGIWIKYNRETEESIEEKLKSGQEPEYIKLYNSLQGYNTGWCTAGARDTAKSQILGGDFYVYYSKDKDGLFKIPRLAIRMSGSSILEIRGIASGQNIESNMEEILEEKLNEFPDRDRYKRRVSDMKKLTIIYNKNLKGEELSKEELMFLYEFDNEISGFGFGKDPRIKEIIDMRDKKSDLSSILGYSKDEIGVTRDDIFNNKNIKYYYGTLDLSDLTSVEELILPEIMKGDLDLSGLKEAKVLVLPKKMDGNFNLENLITVGELRLPNIVNKTVNLENLITAGIVIFPEVIDGSLILEFFREGKNIRLPKIIKGSLNMQSLRRCNEIIFPNEIFGDLDFSFAIGVKGLDLSEILVHGALLLGGVMNLMGTKLSKKVDGYLGLDSLSSLIGITLPLEVGDGVYVYEDFYSLEQVIEMQKREQEQLNNNNHNGLKRVKQDGFISNTIIVLNIILFVILSFILTLLIIK